MQAPRTRDYSNLAPVRQIAAVNSGSKKRYRAIARWLDSAGGARDNSALPDHPMANVANLFRLLNEFIVLLLGALLIVLALSGRVGLPGRPLALMLLGIVLIYWGIRTTARRIPETHALPERIRGASLILVGVLILGIRFLPLRNAELLLELAGGVLVLRGLFGGLMYARRST